MLPITECKLPSFFYLCPMRVTAKELAVLLNGTVEGDPNAWVDRPSKIEEGGAGSISFLGNDKYEPYAYKTDASILLVPKRWQPKQSVQATLLRVDDVYAAIAKLFKQFGQNQSSGPKGISDQAFVHPEAKIGEQVSIGRFAVIEAGAEIGEHCEIGDQVFIGADVQIGAYSKILPGARIMHRCIIGSHCILHPNVIIGSDGFGFAPQQDGSYEKIEQLGNVVIEEWVEVGAGTAIDRATMGSTIIRKGVKLDNLIQIAHNVEIGENTVIAAQAGIAGSTKIGKNCQIGGQVGFVGHVKIADGTQIQAQSGVASSVKMPNQALFGSPAFNYTDYIRSYAIFKKLPELYKRINALEKQLKDRQNKE
jgi:UDP-3-O-[3-hydroxymyristoyl] glucosamine N-acyltransferase